MPVWDKLLARARQLTADQEIIFTDHDEVSHCLKSKYDTSIAEADAQGSRLLVRLTGRAVSPLQLSVFLNEDDGARREYRAVQPFEDQADEESEVYQ